MTVLGQAIMYKGVRQKESRDTKVLNLSLSNFIVADDDLSFPEIIAAFLRVDFMLLSPSEQFFA